MSMFRNILINKSMNICVPTETILVSGAGESYINRTYTLYSGTPGTKNAVYYYDDDVDGYSIFFTDHPFYGSKWFIVSYHGQPTNIEFAFYSSNKIVGKYNSVSSVYGSAPTVTFI